MTTGLCILAVMVLYVVISPKYGERLYRKKLFKDPSSTPSQPQLVLQFSWPLKTHLAITADDGTIMNAWYFQQETRAKTLAIYCIGRASCISNVLDEVDRLLKCGYAVLVTEYRGFGESKGETSLTTVCADSLSIFDYAVEKLDYSRSEIVVFGESLGGGIASYMSEQRQPGGLILRNTFCSLIAIGREHVPFTWIFPKFMHPAKHLNTEAVLRRWQHPVLIVHAVHDETVPYHHGVELYAAAVSPEKTFVALGASTHRVIAPSDESAFSNALLNFRLALEASC